MKTIAWLYFHQGFTDIINSMALITYYSRLYSTLHVIIRSDFENFYIFYIHSYNNVILHSVDHRILNGSLGSHHGNMATHFDLYNKDVDILFIGNHDTLRTDKYKNRSSNTHVYFVAQFYISYDIKYITRVNDFIFERDLELEDKKYTKIIGDKENYILYHDTKDVPLFEIENDIKINPTTFIQLEYMSDTMFDCLKILENATELHLIDSVWACFCFIVDSKYGLFKNKIIHVYCKRYYEDMFSHPKRLDNWKFYIYDSHNNGQLIKTI